MSIVDEIREGLNALLDRVGGDDGPIPNVSRDQITVELARRAEARAGRALGVTHPIALRASSSPKAQAAREGMARKRDATIRKDREARARAEQTARDAAFEDIKRRAEREAKRAKAEGPSRPRADGPGPGPGPGGGASWRDRIPIGRDPKIAKHYQTLGLPYGAPFDQVKKQFRTMMRKYHPDMHSASPDKQKAASELSTQLSVAYAALERHLT